MRDDEYVYRIKIVSKRVNWGKSGYLKSYNSGALKIGGVGKVWTNSILVNKTMDKVKSLENYGIDFTAEPVGYQLTKI